MAPEDKNHSATEKNAGPGGMLQKLKHFPSSSPLLFSFLAVGLLMASTLAFFTPYFHLNDDTFKLFFAKGVGTSDQPSEFIGYSSTVLGLMLKGLYTAFPLLPWYPSYLYLVQFLAISAILYSFQFGSFPQFKTLLFFIGSASIYFYFFKDLQFTLSASIAAQGALFLLADLWRQENPKNPRIKFGLAGILIILSLITRTSAFFLSGLMALPFCLYLAWGEKLTSFRKRFLFYIFFIGVLMAGLILFDYVHYNHDPGWKTFNRFDAQRVILQDYRNPPPDESTQATLASVGWTVNDWQMFLNWYYMDENIFSTEKIKALNDAFSKFNLYGRNPESTLPAIFSLPTDLTVTLFFCAFLFFVPVKPLKILLLNTLWVFLIFLYLIYNLRTPERLTLPALLFLLNGAILFAVPKKQSPDGKPSSSQPAVLIGMGLCALLTLQTFSFVTHEWELNHTRNYYREVLKNSLAAIHPQPNQLYAVWDSSIQYEMIPAFDDYESFRNFHTISLAVYQRSPFAYHFMDQFHLHNLFRDMVDRNDVFLICWPFELQWYLTYMREKFQLEIQPEEIFKSPFNFSVYRMHSAPDLSHSKARG